MKYRDRLIQHLRQRIGECADPADIVDELYGRGGMDDMFARRYVAVTDFFNTYGQCARTPRDVMIDVASDLEMDVSSVFKAVKRTQYLGG